MVDTARSSGDDVDGTEDLTPRRSPASRTDSIKFFLDRKHQLFDKSACNGGLGTNLHFNLTAGLHELIIFDLRHDRLCADTTALLGYDFLPTPQTFFLQTAPDSTLTQLCVDTSQFYGPAQSLIFAEPPLNGSTSAASPGNCFDYAPAPSFFGHDSMTVILKDSWGIADTTYFKIFVKSPTVTTDYYYLTTPFNTPIQNICAIVNEIAATGLNLAVCDAPSNGTMTIQETAVRLTLRTPASGASTRPASCSATMSASATTRIYITVLPPGGSSIDTINITTTVNTAVTNCFPFTLPGTAVSFAFCGQPLNGSVTGVQGNPACVTYTPNNGFIGNDEFCVEICTAFGDADHDDFQRDGPPVAPPAITKDSIFGATDENTPTEPVVRQRRKSARPSLRFAAPSRTGPSRCRKCAVFDPSPGFVEDDAVLPPGLQLGRAATRRLCS